MIGARQLETGVIQHDGLDVFHLGPFYNAAVAKEKQDRLAASFSSLYEAGGALYAISQNITWMRWKKVV